MTDRQFSRLGFLIIGIFLIVTSTISIVQWHIYEKDIDTRAIDTVYTGTGPNTGTGATLLQFAQTFNDLAILADTLGLDDLTAQDFTNLANLPDILAEYPGGSGIPIVVSGSSWGTTITDNSANWNTAYGWGNHATAGYAPTNNATFTGTHVIPLPYTVGTTSVTSVENYPTENYGTTGMGDVVFSIGATLTSPNITNAPVATGTVVAGTGITAAMLSRFMYFNTASAINITSDPQIANGTSGQIITIIGSSDTNTLTLDDSAGLRLTGQMVLGVGDNITLLYEGTIGDWIEISRSNN